MAEATKGLPELTIIRESELYRAFRDVTLALAEIFRGRYAIGVTDIGSNLDILMSLVPREPLL
ncbi:MAG: hypothetical protein LBJ61_05685 [Deltaproteobacteria bacterium]|jgi:hypothetical protein|nr:hypothetical protein [Deltaproteobacteria bacterium]